MRRKLYRIVGKFDDIDLFPAQFADNRLHPHPLHADAGAHAAEDGDFRALAGLAGASLDQNRAVVDFRYFLLEKPFDQFGIRPRDHHARTFRRLVHNPDHTPYAVAHAVAFEAGLLAFWQARFGLAKIHHQIQTFHAFNRRVDQFADAVGILAVNRIPLRFPNLLENHLFRGLRGDPAQSVGRLRNPDHGTDFGARIDAARFGESHLERRIADHVRNRLDGKEFKSAGLLVEHGIVVFGRAKVLAGRDKHRVLHRVENDLGVDALFFTENFNRLKNAVHGIMPRS